MGTRSRLPLVGILRILFKRPMQNRNSFAAGKLAMGRFFLVFVLIIVFSVHDLLGGEAAQVKQKKQSSLVTISGFQPKTREQSLYLHDRVIVKMAPQPEGFQKRSPQTIAALSTILSRISVSAVQEMFPPERSASKLSTVDLSLFYVIQFSSPQDPFTLAEDLSKIPEIEYAEPWFIYSTDQSPFPNDEFYSQQWALPKVKAAEAWGITKGDTSVIIAIVDSGVEWDHPDLSANIWTNPGEIPNNGLDDDGNGLIDDVRGWDFAGDNYLTLQGDNNPSPKGDNNNHGTHVAGIAAATTNNGIGVASIGVNCKILPVKCSADNDTRASGSGFIITGYTGIVYAARMRAHVINCSWGGAGGSQFEQDIINYATGLGALVVAAAGNAQSTSFHSPSSYENVLSVAATNQSDQKAWFSNYGDYVDVAAPGDGILSTIYRGGRYTEGYTYFSGTSMASPLVAGLAGLVKSHFPQLTPLQVGERIRVSCDNLELSDLYYGSLLGRGRVNALRALDTNLPSVRMVRVSISDTPGGNGNGFAQPAETLNVVGLFRNFLAPTSSNATMQLTSASPYLFVVPGTGTFPIPQLGTLDSVSNVLMSFRVYVHPNVPQSHAATLEVRFTDGAYTDVQRLSFLVNPTFATHAINDIGLTLTNNGKIGFFDFPENTLGVGFVFNGENHLFEGGLILGMSSSRVVDIVRNEFGEQNNDFSSSNFYSLTSPGRISHQDGYTTFTDAQASSTNAIGVRVDMYSYAFADPGESKHIILQYDIMNTTGATITNLYAGLFFDWDIGENYDQNISAYDAERSLGYSYDNSGRRREFLGVVALDGAAGFRSLTNTAGMNLSRDAKWDWLSGGFSATYAGPADIHHVISSGPFALNPGQSTTVGFALVAGDSSLANLRQNADAAQAKWQWIRHITSAPHDEVGSPISFALHQNFPNPFNPTTKISYQFPASADVRLTIYNVLGQLVRVMTNDNVAAGVHTFDWDGRTDLGVPVSAGTYFYRLEAVSKNGERFVATKKMLLLR